MHKISNNINYIERFIAKYRKIRPILIKIFAFM